MQRQALELSSAVRKRERNKISFTLLNEHTLQEKNPRKIHRGAKKHIMSLLIMFESESKFKNTSPLCKGELEEIPTPSSSRHRFWTKLRVGLRDASCMPNRDVDVGKIFEQIVQWYGCWYLHIV